MQKQALIESGADGALQVEPGVWLTAASLTAQLLLQESMLQLWCHETFIIIGDRMWDAADKIWLHTQLDNSLKNIFGTSWDDTFGAGQDCPPFVSFMRPVENPPYEPVTDMNALKVRQKLCGSLGWKQTAWLCLLLAPARLLPVCSSKLHDPAGCPDHQA